MTRTRLLLYLLLVAGALSAWHRIASRVDPPVERDFTDREFRIAQFTGKVTPVTLSGGPELGRITGPDTTLRVKRRRLIADRDFQALEAMAARIFKSGHGNPDRGDSLRQFYIDVTTTPDPAGIPALGRALDAWVKARPKSSTAWNARSAFHYDRAWAARGQEFAHKVAQEAWPAFHEGLAQSRRDCLEALRLDPRNPAAHRRILWLNIAEGVAADRMSADYGAALRAAPRYNALHHAMLTYLAPRWLGSIKEMSTFARAAQADTAANPKARLLLVELYKEMLWDSLAEDGSRLTASGREEILRAADSLLALVSTRYPHELELKLLHADFKHEFDRYAQVVPVLEDIGLRWMPAGKWKSLGKYVASCGTIYCQVALRVPPDSAIPLFERAIQLDQAGDFAYPRFKLGRLYLALGRIEEGEALLREALGMKPKFTCDILRTLAMSRAQFHQDTAGAVRHAEAVLSDRPVPEMQAWAKAYLKRLNGT